MPEHKYTKSELIRRLEPCLNKCFRDIDDEGMFDAVQQHQLQKGIAGAVIEKCVFRYDPDSKQEADLVVVYDDEDGRSVKTELKTTGMLIASRPVEHFVAKEPMSITAVGIYDIANQKFLTSHFWEKLEHLLIVYYHYNADHPVSAAEYASFYIKGYEFHEFSKEDADILRRDWELVRNLCEKIVKAHPGIRNQTWKNEVRDAYIERHGELRPFLCYIDLAPKFPPRFRLKQPTVSAMIAQHFGYSLIQLPDKYTGMSDIDKKCREISEKYNGWTMAELMDYFNITAPVSKSIAEKIVIAMFGGDASRLNQIEVFAKFGLIAKNIVVTARGNRTEDMKLFHVNFNEIAQIEIAEEDGTKRDFGFEDSQFYTYFADHEFLCILFEESDDHQTDYSQNRFIGFKRLCFSDEFIDKAVAHAWNDVRYKVLTKTLQEVESLDKDGNPIINKSGTVRSALNLLKSRDNDVFIKCSATDTSPRSRTEHVNGLSILPQYVWIKGSYIVNELENLPLL